MCIKSEVREILFKLATNDHSDEVFCWNQNFGPNGLSPPTLGLCLNFFSSITADFNISSALRWAIQDKWSSGLNLQRMGKLIRAFCWHQKFVPKGLYALAPGLYTCIKSLKMYIKSDFEEIILKLATNGQSDKGFPLTSTFVPKGLSAPALGLYTCIKALKCIPGPVVRWAFTGPLVLWFIGEGIIVRHLNRNGSVSAFLAHLNKKLIWWAYRIGWPPSSSVVRRPHSVNIFSLETTGPIKVKFLGSAVAQW